MRLFTLLSGYVLLMLGVILSIHFDFTIGVLIATTFTIKWFFMFPQMEGRNDR